ncbi:putative lipoprotein-anchoring transpeptidase, ErfK/SrfK family [Aliarcobacter faecis]|uniref:L,D-transpeptidase n=1 Tax=Aliarcobacter faecis TaxID=1564138 RepID=UPI0004B8225B|nr:L,D-transpeptidase [Aliarcobacter faecis]QKF73848.1 putative lipoprotein-anchoring transpeptidase, ErfK/SrfK family [Aliarcobacter faecis]
MKKLLFFSLFVNSLYATNQHYSIEVCVTKNLENAEYCKNHIKKSMEGDVYIVEENNRFYTYLNLFDDKNLAYKELRYVSEFVKKQKPYVKAISNYQYLAIKSNENKINPKPIEKVEIKPNIVEELIDNAQLNHIPTDENINEEIVESNGKSNLALEIIESDTDKIEENLPKAFVSNVNLNEFDNILIKVNSKTNIMELKGVKNSVETLIRTYLVATARAGVKKPQGKGNISELSLNPYWYPTSSIRKSFARKGINLPNVVPPNHKYNYMGAAKLNLTHSVNGDTSYRIHGTLNESTLGKNVSAGCIRMKNSEIVELTKAFQKIDLKKIIVYLF